ncbi:MAG: hypothetical protein G01um10143_159 [Parcubacteria group bacterium Gr01-1014_3]|nr:MAG: hypothetical protein G01um10143_159 [Parcubacteria group bacterium Gr01-1014_3]
MNKTLFLFLKNSLFISDLLKTNYIKELVKKYRVIIFSNVIDSDTKQILSALNVECVPWKIQNPRLFAVTKYLRTVCMHEFDKVSSLQFYYDSPAFRNDKRARLLRLISWPFAPFLTSRFFTALELFFMRRSSLLEEYVKKYQPSLIMTATPGVQVFDAEAILYGKKMGIPTLATNISWDNLTSFKCVRSRKPDYLFVWNQVLKDAAIKIHHFSPDRIFVTGSMRFDQYFDVSRQIPSRDEFLSIKGLNPKYKTILFASGGRAPNQPTIFKKILDLRKSGVIPYVNFLVRPHPFDEPEWYRIFLSEPDIFVERISEPKKKLDAFVNLKATLAYTDININHKSTISLESFIFDKPVINFIDPALLFQNKHYFDESSYYYPLIKEKAIRFVPNDEEMLSSINEYLANPMKDSENRQRVADRFFVFRDGLSYRRNVDLIEKIT